MNLLDELGIRSLRQMIVYPLATLAPACTPAANWAVQHITKLGSSQAKNRQHQFFVLRYILETSIQHLKSKHLISLWSSKQHTTPSNEEAGVRETFLIGKTNKQTKAENQRKQAAAVDINLCHAYSLGHKT
jgi:hypothetical protein